MKIHADQMAALEKAARDSFHQRLKGFLREELPEQTAGMDDASLMVRIADSEHRAAMYGVTSQSGIAQWTCLTFLGGPQFHELPDVHDYLLDEHTDLTPEEKLEVLIDELGAED
jgi:hypothetical protein